MKHGKKLKREIILLDRMNLSTGIQKTKSLSLRIPSNIGSNNGDGSLLRYRSELWQLYRCFKIKHIFELAYTSLNNILFCNRYLPYFWVNNSAFCNIF